MMCILLAKLMVCEHCLTYVHHWIKTHLQNKHLQLLRLNNHRPPLNIITCNTDILSPSSNYDMLSILHVRPVIRIIWIV